MTVPYAAPPTHGPDVLGTLEYERQMEAYLAYQQWLGEQTPDDADSTVRHKVARDVDAGRPLDRIVYKATWTDAEGTPHRWRREYVASSRQDKGAVQAHAHQQLEDHINQQGGGAINRESCNRPRGKPMQSGKDKRRNTEGSTAKGGNDAGGGDGADNAPEDNEGEQDGDGNDGQGDGDSGDGEGEGEGDSEGEGQNDDDRDPVLEDVQRQMEQLAAQSEQQAQQGQSDAAASDLVLMRKHNAPWEGDLAEGHIAQTAGAAVAPAIKQLAESVKATAQRVASVKATVDPEQVRALIAEALENVAVDPDETRTSEGTTLREEIEEIVRDLTGEQQTTMVVETVDRETGAVVHSENVGPQHAVFPRVLGLVRQRKHVLLVGPTGCGKTHLAEAVATALNMRYHGQSVTSGMSEGVLLGRYLPVSVDGSFAYVPSAFIDWFENGGVFLLDEMDAADPTVLLAINQALANGRISIPNRPEKPVAVRHADFVLIAAMNTYGTGANRLYVGRNRLDDATLDRFRIGQVDMDFDRGLEQMLVKDKAVREHYWRIRDAVNQHRLTRNISTRFLLDAQAMVKGEGWSLQDCDTALLAGWTADEISKVQGGSEASNA